MTEFNFDTVFDETMQTRNLDTVVILGHLNPDGDAAGSVMGLAHYIKINYPQYKVLPYLADTLDKGPKKQVKLDKVFDPFEKPDVKEKYAMRYTLHRGLVHVTNWVRLKFAAMNLKKFAIQKWNKEGNFCFHFISPCFLRIFA